MRRFLMMASAFVLAGLIASADVQACGNKIMAGGRGVRYRLMRSGATTISILVYKNSSLPTDSRINDPKFYSAMKDVGRNFTIATNVRDFDADLTSGKYDIVIADASDLAVLTEFVRVAPSKPLLIPMIASSKKIREDDYVKYVDQAIKSKQK